MIGPESAHSPFEAFSLIAAPALLTNATCVLAMGTVNRMLRTRDRMHELFIEARKNPELVTPYMLAQTQRVERQAILLLQALAAIYVALGAFAAGTLMTLIGGSLKNYLEPQYQGYIVLAGVCLVFVGVTSLVFGSVRLFQATQSSLTSLRVEAEVIRSQRPLS
jgi:hypothetical protein